MGFATAHGIIEKISPGGCLASSASAAGAAGAAGGQPVVSKLDHGNQEQQERARSNRRVRFLSQFLRMWCYIYMYTLNRQRHRAPLVKSLLLLLLQCQFLLLESPAESKKWRIPISAGPMAKQFEFPRLPVGFDIFAGHFPAETNHSNRSLLAACRQVPGFPAATPGSRQEQQAQMRLQHEQQPLAECGCGEYSQRG